MENKKIWGIAIIGCGGISKIHANAIQEIENAKIIACYDYSLEFAKTFANSYNAIAYECLDELLKNDGVDIVSICVPSGLHAEIAIKSANAKKHIILEKPMAITEQELEDIINAVNQNGVKMEVISQLRFTPAIKKAKTAIDNGELGKILHVDYVMKYNRSQEYYDKGGWRGTWAMDGGGAVMNQGIHGIDIINYLVGDFKSVYANCLTMDRNIQTEDTAYMLVEYKCGAVGVINCTTCCEPGYAKTISISGTKGTIVIEEDNIKKWDVIGSNFVIQSKSVVNSSSSPLDFSCEYHKLQIVDLINAIQTSGTPLVNEIEGAKAVKLILSAYKSSKENIKVEL